jgi:anti-anti-sigma factor
MALTDWSEDILIADLSDEPSFSDDMDALCRRLDQPPKKSGNPAHDVILNMNSVSYLNSSNLAQLLKVRKKLSLAGRKLRVCAVNDAVWSILMTTGLDQVFSFNDDVSMSLASIQMEA